MEGWIKLHRKLSDNPIWFCEKFTRGQAWVDLILLANHQNSYFYKRGVKIDVKRGQIGRSEVELSDRWKWSRSKVRKFLKDLEKEHQITQHKTNVTQLLTIINYDQYQEKRHQKDTKKTLKEHQKNTYKNVKNTKNNNNKIYPDFFNENLIKTYLEFKTFRTEKGKSITKTQEPRFFEKLKKLSKGQPKIAAKILIQSIGNGWQGIFEVKDNGQVNIDERPKPKQILIDDDRN